MIQKPELRFHEMDPELRLKWLRRYMNRKINSWPHLRWSFELYLLKQIPQLIPGSPYWARNQATHCFYCKQWLLKWKTWPENPPMNAATIDHWNPRSRGGTDIYVICCFKCNSVKSNLDPGKFVGLILSAYLNKTYTLHYGRKLLKVVHKQVMQIFKDIIDEKAQTVYYIKNNNNGKVRSAHSKGKRQDQRRSVQQP